MAAPDDGNADRESMRHDWETRARTTPLYAIDASRRQWALDDFYARGPELVREFVDPALRKLGVDPMGRRVLEIGCGMGRLFAGLGDRFSDVWGMDISSAMIELGRLHCPVSATWLVGDGDSLTGVDTGSVDHVLSFEAFEHIPKPEIITSYLRETERVLRPGGTFQIQLRRGSDSTRQAIVRSLPRPLRAASGVILRAAGVLHVRGDIDTWLGCVIHPHKAMAVLRTLGFIDVSELADPFEGPSRRLSACYWVVGRKPPPAGCRGL
jgi:SAM-dependent methyltransferase